MGVMSRKGQSTVELAVLLAVVIAALLAMQGFMKRGVMGKLEDSTNQIGSQFTPLGYSHAITTTFKGARTEVGTPDGKTVSTIDAADPEVQNRSGTAKVESPLDDETVFFVPTP